MEEYVDFYGGTVFRTVYNSMGARVYDLPIEVLQQQTRDLLEALNYRWSHEIPCGSLIPSNVRVRDNVAMLPGVDLSADTRQYPLILQRHVEAVYGTTGSRQDRDDFLAKLKTPGLTRRQFESLYYHEFLQNQEQRADFPADVVENLRDRWVWYNGALMHWEDAYSSWEQQNYNQKFKLYDTCSQHPHHYWAFKVYLHGTYLDDSVNQVKLARNIVRHINDHLWKARIKRLYSKRDKSAIIYELFPNIGSRWFEFLWELEIDLDFKKSRKYFRST